MQFKFRPTVWLAGIFLAAIFLFPPFVSATLAEIVTATSTPAIVERVMGDNAIYLGENHDSAAIHQQQLEIITQLQEKLDRNSSDFQGIAIAWEMFQRPFQPILDRYLSGTISESQLQLQTEYDDRWGFDWEFYAPILRFAQEQQIPLIALNTPAEITQKVAESGIESLKGSDYRYIPPLAEIKLDNAEYRQRLNNIYQQHVEEGQGNSTDAANFFAAQVLWDETMAEAIAQRHLAYPQEQIVVLVGKAHVMYDYAIPNRVVRRINNPDFAQSILLLEASSVE
ncbi:MAG: ChaN family lipoprotein [Cyanobacteria bacterium J06629_2]